MRKLVMTALVAILAGLASGEIVIENAKFRLALGEDATVRSLTLKASGEELLSLRDPIPFCSVTQERPFNNEIKLAHPNAETTYPANRVRREGDRLIVGFEIAPYEAAVTVKVTDDYVTFTLEDFLLTEKSYPLCPTTTKPLDFTAPRVLSFRLLQLPVKDRANYGEWLGVVWDERAAVSLLATSPHAIVSQERRNGYRLLNADALRSVKVRGTGVALAVDAGRAILDRIDALERDFNLPRGVQNRRNPLVNASIYFACGFSPKTVDEHIRWAKKGGFRLMQVSLGSFCDRNGDYLLNDRNYPNGLKDVKAALDKVRAAGIVPGLHILHTFVSPGSSLVKGGADRRLLLQEHYTLAKTIGAGDTEIYVDENPQNAEMSPKCRILKFGRELMSYEGYTTEPPYKFVGVKRGIKETPVSVHEEGTIGGTLWICEYGGYDIYAKQDSDLQDIFAAKLAEIWKTGLNFIYFDGSEGVCPPFAYNVPNAQYRMWRALEPQPLLGEGAAKAHFGWHMLSGANAFDVFFPEEFKQKIDEYPAAEAPLMQQDFTRVNFGWWGFWAPNTKIRDKVTIGVQPDMWEYGTAKAAAWDSPISIQMNPETLARHPRSDDIMEVMRRWEDVRAKNWLTDEMKEKLRVPGDEYHLLIGEDGAYELVKLTPVKTPPEIRAFSFELKGARYLVYSHTSGEGPFAFKVAPNAHMKLFDAFGGPALDFTRNAGSVTLPAGRRRYFRY